MNENTGPVPPEDLSPGNVSPNDAPGGGARPAAWPTRPVPRGWAALAGLVAGGLAVGVGIAVAALIDVVSPIDAVGGEVIDRVPGWVKEFAVRNFGTNDKLALRIGIVSILALVALAAGALGRHRRRLGVGIVGLFGIVGVLAALHRPAQTGSAAWPSVIGALVGCGALWMLLRPWPIEVPGRSQAPLGWDRRRFLAAGGTGAAVAVVAGAIGRTVDDARIDDARRAAREALTPGGTAGAGSSGTAVTTVPYTVPDGAQVDAQMPFVIANRDFYRIDTALSFPRISAGSWKCEIGGMVDTPFTLSYADLLAMPQVERMITLSCVSNEVGGNLIGNAVWRGVLLADVLARAVPKPGATQVFSTSYDGWTCGSPLDVVTDGRDALLAIGMNGEALPLEHGFPVRLVVPGLYGYVSATKWLAKIELTDWTKEGYWVPRGWSQQGPIKTQSRIDLPRPGAAVTAVAASSREPRRCRRRAS